MDRMAWSSGLTGQGKETPGTAWNRNKNVLFVSESFGSGHTRAAQALAKGIRATDGEVRVQLVELGRELRPQVNQALVYSYLGMIQKAPGLWRRMYGKHDGRSFPRWIQWCLYQTLYSSLADYIADFRPQVIVSTHPFASAGVARLKKEGLPVRLCTVITDFCAHGSWVNPEVDLYLVPHQGMEEQLAAMGVDRKKVAVTGIPTDSRFWISHSKEEARNKLGIHHMPTVLIMGGGFGMGRTEELVATVAKWRERLQIIVCTGYNQKLRQALSSRPECDHPHIRITGFTREMADWMDAADVLLTKPGGMTCTEAIVKGKPLLLFGSIPGQEEGNGRFMVDQGLAHQAADKVEVNAWLAHWLAHPECLDPMRKRMMEWRWNIHPSKSIRAVLGQLVPPYTGS
ncbi:MGDG synthase family glycosyltransferase [Desmospora profundinema]|uniref:Processive 1,2-diacylglycerol beta-glucosyltransferase n=1 Tax=Desmospora profundinema TaxID=1571184 RepID=A0ABU1IM04_9BACL|nr:glycosyltransferase [Desmospora profundinema]MDR6225814.1 processive 1,2-diacylglycerol beta-glucosyltransferase [Desmospora profundinema]